MRIEMQAEGLDVAFAVINLASAPDFQEELVSRCSFPLFQDLTEVDAVDLHHGHQDDILVYDRDLELAAYLPADGEMSTNLSGTLGYQNVWDAIVAAQ